MTHQKPTRKTTEETKQEALLRLFYRTWDYPAKWHDLNPLQKRYLLTCYSFKSYCLKRAKNSFCSELVKTLRIKKLCKLLAKGVQ